jgi:hypothetical protein
LLGGFLSSFVERGLSVRDDNALGRAVTPSLSVGFGRLAIVLER